jgi:hypothetical protein
MRHATRCNRHAFQSDGRASTSPSEKRRAFDDKVRPVRRGRCAFLMTFPDKTLAGRFAPPRLSGQKRRAIRPERVTLRQRIRRPLARLGAGRVRVPAPRMSHGRPPLRRRAGPVRPLATATVGLMPPARVIAGPRALLTSILACYEGVPSGIGGWRANPRTQTTVGGGRSFPGSTGTFTK